ncbi:helix-turn-helix transcriptional regulator [Rhodopirellula europaea]|uniref:helix-turn-helix transcriptional regulator n=1 Tax=Rhodopirellula europaea TaxID=1263866 RepID=UPI003D2AA5C0|tara:strand:+ start:61 stop:852 length:792 start_codon:yes stop_codon:yes gene_type:complete
MVQQVSAAIHRLAYRRPFTEDRRVVDRWLNTHFSAALTTGMLATGILESGSNRFDASPPDLPAESFRASLTELRLESGVFLMDDERRLIAWNQTLEDLFVEVEFTATESLPSGLPSEMVQMLMGGGELIALGALELDYSFQSKDDRGRMCVWDVSSIRREFASGDSAISATLVRPVALLKADATEQGLSLSESLLVYQQFDSVDRQICEAIAMGDTTGEIATMVGLTRRSVEVRRAKILERLQFTRPVEIVRLLVRLEENGLL